MGSAGLGISAIGSIAVGHRARCPFMSSNDRRGRASDGSSSLAKAILAAASLAAAVLSAACSPATGSSFGKLGQAELRVVLPSAPASWSALPGLDFRLCWRDAGGRMRSALAPPGSSLSIELERGVPQAILAKPSSVGRSLLPAGALYPEGLTIVSASEGRRRRDELRLDWPGGYASSVALALEEAGIDPWAYDLGRLVDAAMANSSDPWLLPPLEVARRLSARDFRISLFKEAERFRVILPGGTWWPESPFEDIPVPEADTGQSAERASLARLSPGLWRFLGRDSLLFVSVDESGGSTILEY